MESLRIHFVSSPDDASPSLKTAYEICKRYESAGLDIRWIDEDEVLELKDLTSKDVFVLEEFSGVVFEALIKTAAVVVGARCVSCCLMEGSKIPPSHPIYTIAMRDLTVTFSGINVELQQKLRNKIFWMGGDCASALSTATTHLITSTVLSQKYNKARQLGIKVMKADWVEAAWDASLENNVSANDARFAEYEIPVFHGIVLTITSLATQKKELKSLVKRYGGKAIAEFRSEDINLLLTDSTGIGSEKYKAAAECKIPCVFPAWIHDSIKAGYALDISNYKVETKTSSPNRVSQLPMMNLDISSISHVRRLNETCSMTASDSADGTKASAKSQRARGRLCGAAKEFAMLADSIEIKEVKQAGAFLDGCGIYVYGFTMTRRDKLQRVISRLGGIRYDRPSESVTHAICGDPTAAVAEMKDSTMPRALHVTVKWLTDSIKAQRALEETPYLVTALKKINVTSTESPALQSPMSKRNLQLLRTPSRLPPVPLFAMDDDDKPDDKDEIVQQYVEFSKLSLNEHESTLIKPNNTVLENDDDGTKDDDATVANIEDVDSEPEEDATKIFTGITFEIQDIEEEAEQISQRIIDAGGMIIPQGIGGDYIVVPMNCDDVHVINNNSEVVTSTWLDDCLSRQQLVSIDYYHRPVKLTENSKPLSGLVFALSTYTGIERVFINEIAQLLGATVQKSLFKITTAAGMKSTHLICPEASGAKYVGAMSWGLPVVSSQWLLDCASANRRLDEEPYIVDTVDDETVEKDTTATNKENEAMNEQSTAFNDDVEFEEILQPDNQKPSTSKFSAARLAGNTPIRNLGRLSAASELSPASKYLAMAQQGMFESQETPKRSSNVPQQESEHDDSFCTPPLDNALSTPNLALFSPTSRRRLEAIKRGQRPSNPPTTPKNPFDVSVSTPESPFGAILRPDKGKLSPRSRKKLMNFCNNLPSPSTSNVQSRKSTPMSELKRKFFEEFSDSKRNTRLNVNKLNISRTNEPTTPQAKVRKLSEGMSSRSSPNVELQNQLKQLNAMLTGETPNKSLRNSKIRKMTASPEQHYLEHIDATVNVKQIDSQVDTVGWDDATHVPCEVVEKKSYKFTMSQNIDNCDELKIIIERLGGSVIVSSELCLDATHLLCTRLSRSEKFLGSLAAGKWILHPIYIIKCQEAGRFLNEELYEWGNPKAVDIKITKDEEPIAKAIYRWRMKRLESNEKPFQSMKVIMHIQEERKRPLLRVLEAGGGTCVDFKPPFKGNTNATICLVEPRRMGLTAADAKYLAARQIPICPPLILNYMLINDPHPKPEEHIHVEYREMFKF